MDGRGTPRRSAAWQRAVHKDFITQPLEDQAEAGQPEHLAEGKTEYAGKMQHRRRVQESRPLARRQGDG